jgi:hypothetical protein
MINVGLVFGLWSALIICENILANYGKSSGSQNYRQFL